MESPLIQDGVIRNLQTLGQSVLKISDALKAPHPEVDWRSIVGFRNVLVHDYLGINLIRVWQIVENDLPDLKQKITAILKSIESYPHFKWVEWNGFISGRKETTEKGIRPSGCFQAG